MTTDNLIQTICYILDIEPINGSYVDALGAYFNVTDQPEKPYDKEVLVSAIVNGDGTDLTSPDGLSYIQVNNDSIDVFSNNEFLLEANSNLAIIGDENVTLGNYGGTSQLFINGTDGEVILKSNDANLILYGNNESSSIVLSPTGAIIIDPNTYLFLNSLGVYANDAAAGASGVTSGACYKTTIGGVGVIAYKL